MSQDLNITIKSAMTHQELAAILNGREYGDEITKAEEVQAQLSGLVVVFGYSDDNVEMRGAIHDEVGCYEGGVIGFNARGPVPKPDRDEREVLEKFGVLEQVLNSTVSFEAKWCDEPGGPSWTYEAAFPHSTFEVMEDGGVYCRGMVFSLKEALEFKAA